MAETHGYETIRLTLMAFLGTARIPLQVDIRVGDLAVPDPREETVPSLLDLPLARLRAYRPETVVAEKFHAIVDLGALNTRLKDFYDLWILSDEQAFDGPSLVEAVEATFSRRERAIPEDIPIGLLESFGSDAAKGRQWAGFCRRARTEAIPFERVQDRLRTFLMPVSHAARTNTISLRRWSPGGPWT